MSSFLSQLPGSSKAEFWNHGNSFGVDVDDLKLKYTSTDIVTGLPGAEKKLTQGKLYYSSSLPEPIPLGDSLATVVKEATDESGQPRLYIIFQNGDLGNPTAANTFAIFEFADVPAPEIFTLTQGIGQWEPKE